MELKQQHIPSMLEGFSERMKHISMFAPILRVEQPTKFKNLPVPTIALYVLLYMLENKLAYNKSTTSEELESEVFELVRSYWDSGFTREDAKELEQWLISKHLRNNGNAHTFTYHDLERQEDKTVQFHLIEYGKDTSFFDDDRTDSDDFVLTSTGLELLFNTKEVFSELRITMTQLFFKRQFEKGLFSDALGKIREMHALIEDEKKRIQQLQKRIVKDALSVSQRDEMEEILKRINDALKAEREQFKELESLVEEKIDEYYEGLLTEKERAGINLIQEIQGKLNGAMTLHESLFTEKQKTQNIMSESLESSIVHAFSVHLDFDQEILLENLERPARTSTLNKIAKPLLPFHVHKSFNPLLALAPQKRIRRKESHEEEITEVDEEIVRKQEEQDAKEKQKQEKVEFQYLRALLKPLVSQESYLLSDILKGLNEGHSELFNHITYNPNPFLGFITELHQSEYNRFEQVEAIVWKNFSEEQKINRLLIQLTYDSPDLESIHSFSLLETNQYRFIGTMRYRNVKIIRGDYYGLDAKNRREGF